MARRSNAAVFVGLAAIVGGGLYVMTRRASAAPAGGGRSRLVTGESGTQYQVVEEQGITRVHRPDGSFLFAFFKDGERRAFAQSDPQADFQEVALALLDFEPIEQIVLGAQSGAEYLYKPFPRDNSGARLVHIFRGDGSQALLEFRETPTGKQFVRSNPQAEQGELAKALADFGPFEQ